jgi:hypothetical protein
MESAYGKPESEVSFLTSDWRTRWHDPRLSDLLNLQETLNAPTIDDVVSIALLISSAAKHGSAS